MEDTSATRASVSSFHSTRLHLYTLLPALAHLYELVDMKINLALLLLVCLASLSVEATERVRRGRQRVRFLRLRRPINNVFLRSRQGRAQIANVRANDQQAVEVVEVPLLEDVVSNEATGRQVNNRYGAPESRSEPISTSYGVGSNTNRNVAVVEEVVDDEANDDEVEIVEVRDLEESDVEEEEQRNNDEQVVYYLSSNNRQQSTSRTSNTQRQPTSNPVPILRSSMSSPGEPGHEKSFGYSFEAANGIKQEATGEMKRIGNSEVAVMRGSYEYIGDDGQTYVVDWYADETGYHPSAPHLPQPVEIPFPEQAEAVEAQVRFAEEERKQRQRSRTSYSAPANDDSSIDVIEVRQQEQRQAADAYYVDRTTNSRRRQQQTPRTSYGARTTTTSSPSVIEVRANNNNYGAPTNSRANAVEVVEVEDNPRSAEPIEVIEVVDTARSASPSYNGAGFQVVEVVDSRAGGDSYSAPFEVVEVIDGRDSSAIALNTNYGAPIEARNDNELPNYISSNFF